MEDENQNPTPNNNDVQAGDPDVVADLQGAAENHATPGAALEGQVPSVENGDGVSNDVPPAPVDQGVNGGAFGSDSGVESGPVDPGVDEMPKPEVPPAPEEPGEEENKF